MYPISGHYSVIEIWENGRLLIFLLQRRGTVSHSHHVTSLSGETICMIERIDYCEIMESYVNAGRRKWFGFNVNICQILSCISSFLYRVPLEWVFCWNYSFCLGSLLLFALLIAPERSRSTRNDKPGSSPFFVHIFMELSASCINPLSASERMNADGWSEIK